MTVHEWLGSERDYEVGRLLYAALGNNDRLKQMLSSGPNHYNREALAWELTKLQRAGVVVDVMLNPTVDYLTAQRQQLSDATFQAAVLSSPDATETLQKVENSDEKEESSPEKGTKLLDELKGARRPLYDERDGVHAQLEPAASEEERRLLAVRLMSLYRQLDANWETTHYVAAHGELPPAPAAAPGLDQLPPAELLKRRNNLRSQVSKLKNKPHRADDLVRVEAELVQVETLLNPTNGQ
jgi:hypothetical protein